MNPPYRSNRVRNLLTVCDRCHTAKNHKPSGALWGIMPKATDLAAATYMSSVRWRMYEELVLMYPEIDIRIQYGAKTAVVRRKRHIAKSHANDAYCIGKFRPVHRCRQTVSVKKRRNNRILSKFYDAKYIDIRDGKKKSGSQLSCGRTNRRESRHTEKNERIFRGQKCSKGRDAVRRQHYPYQPGDRVMAGGSIRVIKGLHCGGKNAEFIYDGLPPKSMAVSRLKTVYREGGWSSRSN